ncbi:2-octaprenyl-6-methoxyphenyl hydroxylase [Catenovulum maritimum]|uniref:FAD-binding domain-containing protein n=1 Tax=Catenovulum maritimum TaxID=1513271 RepID=A0A0J8GM20_9ALTE|nr:2-octaprenyl-6-methoxyphenyl hydroxylase [Catenovulum maritimum]KMT63872.1 hypothetical protein XM47_17530 [Catenovulum maritimum]
MGKTTPIEFDLVIVGGGLAGLSMANALLSNPVTSKLNIAIVEAFEAKNSLHTSFDAKAIAIAYGSAMQLANWQVWPYLKNLCQPIQKIEVSELGSAGYSFLDCPENQSALGFVVEAQQFGAALTQSLADLKNADSQLTWFCPDELVSLAQSSAGNLLQLKSGQVLSTKLVLACDGGNSQLRQLISPRFQQDDYSQFALTANIAVDKAHQNIAYERFTENGPLALLPMADDRFGVVWCGEQTQVADRMALSDADFIQALQAAFGYRAGRITQLGARASYPLKRSWVSENYHQGVVFLANASHTVHPIAGQGFNLGLRDIAAATKSIEAAVLHKQDLSSYQTWQGYLQQRQGDIHFVLNSTDNLVRLFSNQNPLLKLGRNIGLLGLEFLPPVKRKLAQSAMGLNSGV